MDKKCKQCLEQKPEQEFYKQTKGTMAVCKECHKSNVRENRARNIEYYRQYDAKRYQEDPRVRERHRRYSKTEAGKTSIKRSRKKWLDQNPDKRAAHVILRNALRAGRVVKKKTCERCGSGGRIEGHHGDYTKPLDVVWLCRSCHVKEHAREKDKDT